MRKNQFKISRDALTLIAGTSAAQAISFAISPILTRLYTPKDFGILALFIAITSILGSIANGRYEFAIMLPSKDEDAINILAGGLLVNITLSLCLFLTLLIFHSYIATLINNKEILPWLYFSPASVFFIGCFNLLNYFYNRLKNYKSLAKANIYKSIGATIVQLSLGFLNTGAAGLILGQIFSQIISNIKLIVKIEIFNFCKHIKISNIIFLSKKYKEHPLYLLPTTLMDIFSLKIPIFSINYFVNTAMAGQYILVERILSVPCNLIGSSVGQVFYQEFCYLIQNNKYHDAKMLLINTWRNLFKIGIIPFSLILLFGEKLFIFIFGHEWAISGKISQLLSLMYFTMFVSSPTSSAYNALNMQRLNFVFGVLVLIYRIIIFVFIIKNSLTIALVLYVALEILQIGLYNFLIIRRLK